MTDQKKHRPPSDDEVVFLDDTSGDDVSRAFEDAVRAVTAVEARHRQGASGSVFPPADGDEIQTGSAVPRPQETAPVPQEFENVLLVRAEAELEAERARSEKAEEEARQLREALLRKTADLENVKRRTEREKSDHFRFALAEAFRELLGVVDNFERALAHAPEDVLASDFGIGVGMIERQLSDVLRRYGLTEVPAEHLPFDPNIHEAVAREETSDVAPGFVIAVFQKGYLLNDRLLRPAMVKVSALPQKPRPEDAQ